MAIVYISCFACVHGAERKKIWFTSTLDASKQPAFIILPDENVSESNPQALLVSLHSWSHGMEQRRVGIEKEAIERGWVYLFPHFRGRNNNPQACASRLAQQDIIDALDWTLAHYPINKKRIYLAGFSGGGHMALMMVGKYPQRWTAVSAWAPISDLASWQQFHGDDRYARETIAVCGGRPGDSPEVDCQYFQRSPINFLSNAANVPLEIAAGLHDGHTTEPVPVSHTLEAYNVLAKVNHEPEITNDEIQQLSRRNGCLTNPKPCDQVEDPTYNRAIYLRRQAGNTRVTIFDGDHEQLPHAAAEWLQKHTKKTSDMNADNSKLSPTPHLLQNPTS